MVLPSGSTDGILCMLEAYFDDSGTHDDSEIVLWAGLFGNRYQWEFFNQLWAKKLADPSPGKPPIKRFHMVDCYNSTGEFAGWRRAATDFLAHELTNVSQRRCSEATQSPYPERTGIRLSRRDSGATHLATPRAYALGTSTFN